MSNWSKFWFNKVKMSENFGLLRSKLVKSLVLRSELIKLWGQAKMLRFKVKISQNSDLIRSKLVKNLVLRSELIKTMGSGQNVAF